MKATYNNHVIEAAIKGGLYTVTIDGKPADIKPSRYGRVMIKKAVQACQELDQEQEIKNIKETEKS